MKPYGRSQAPRSHDPCEGLLLVDKPTGPTSHDIVDAIRRKFRFQKVGHGGTLDPMATGLLVILLGRGTKLSNHVMGSDKIYEGTMRFGITTDSDDADGAELSRADCGGVTRDQVEAEMKKLTGDIMQTPPMVSAVKIKGVPLYKLARKGQTVEREARLIHIYEFSLKRFELPDADFVLRCTKGTYVRTLCADIGKAVGCGAHLYRLRRTRSGNLKVDDTVPFDKLMNMTLDQLEELVIPIHQVVMEKL